MPNFSGHLSQVLQCKRPLVQGVASGLSIPCFTSLGPAVVPAARARMGISQKRTVKAF
jgi:hypothetical protein